MIKVNQHCATLSTRIIHHLNFDFVSFVCKTGPLVGTLLSVHCFGLYINSLFTNLCFCCLIFYVVSPYCNVSELKAHQFIFIKKSSFLFVFLYVINLFITLNECFVFLHDPRIYNPKSL